jgi:ubiquinone/menaquinone biosynthesis C-methylase UbiE
MLDVGCGTGHFTRWLAAQHFRVIGLDISRVMLTEAQRVGTGTYVEGDALDLPFCSRCFDLAVLVTTLEFVSDPVRALAEAFRVSRHGAIFGVLNRRSRLGQHLKAEGGPIWKSARFFSPRELVQVCRQALAGRRARLIWRTTLWRSWPTGLPLPWGGFIGLAVEFS